ncbi:class I SAM-dependent methyltransferase [Hyphococcus sp.]|uniref:class I SAM-dependent methyltransferase n=1 Tax=Hyphococcus sp. TaxID=2038636 RepID=UPI003CCC2A5E
MPRLETDLHLKMLEQGKRKYKDRPIYGLHWGDPEVHGVLANVRDRWIVPYVDAEKTCVEIGVGGGRWTRYLTGFKKVYAVDYHEEMFAELKKTVDAPNIEYVKNNGDDFPGVAPGSVDYLFTFGTFVHIDLDIIERYLENIRKILKPDARAFIQYSDKTKERAKQNEHFSINTPGIMVPLVESKGFKVLEEERENLKNASCIFIKPV